MEKVTKKLVYLDTETTGIEPKDRLVQIAYRVGDKEVNELFKPELPMSIDAMAVCHITDEMLEDKEEFKTSDTAMELSELLAHKDTVLVAHNAKFDIEMLRREGIKVPHHICTYKIAQHLDPEAIIPKYNLQYLRYLLKFNIVVTAHDALGDVIILERLFERLFDKFFAQKDVEIPFAIGDDALDEMIKISENPVLIKKFTFGKHIREFVKDVAENDRGYLEWLKKQKESDTIKDEDWLYTLNYYGI